MQFTENEGTPLTLTSNIRPKVYSTHALSDIKAFLKRPILVNTYSWTTARVLGDNIFGLSPAADINGSTIWANKLLGFRFLRCTIKYKIILNASPFHAGAVMLLWNPLPQPDYGSNNMHRTPICASQLPGTIMTTSDDAIEMTIPWIHATHYYDRVSPTFDWGVMHCKVYSALSTGTGATTVNFGIYMWLEDVELSGLVPQSSGFTTKRKTTRVIPSDDEKNNGEGPITRALGIGVKVADSLKDIPMFTAVCKPASWVLNVGKSVSSSFGWSKPSLGEGGTINLINRQSDAYSNNVNGTDTVFPINPAVDAAITPSPMLSIRTEDEMSTKFIARQWSYFANFNMATTDIANTLLYSTDCKPIIFNSSYTVPYVVNPLLNYTIYSMTPLCYLGNIFEVYRGSIEFKFVIVKTGFHAGQISFSFTPYNAVPSFANQVYTYREHVDLQTGESFCFSVPFINDKPFVDRSQGIGYLSVNVVSPLICPSTVSSTINILVYVRGGEDIEFQKPTQNVPIPCLGPQMLDVRPQGFDVDETGPICEVVKPIGGASKDMGDMIMTQHTLGEQINSLLQLTKKFSRLIPQGGSLAVALNKAVSLNPHSIGSAGVSILNPMAVSATATDYVARFAWLYLYKRGGVKLKVKNFFAASNTIVQWSYLPYGSGTGSTITAVDLPTVTGNDSIYSNYTSEPNSVATGVSFPQYSRCFGYMTTFSSTINNNYNDENTLLAKFGNAITLGGNDADSTNLYRAGADDLHFSFFLGIPTVILSSTPV